MNESIAGVTTRSTIIYFPCQFCWLILLLRRSGLRSLLRAVGVAVSDEDPAIAAVSGVVVGAKVSVGR